MPVKRPRSGQHPAGAICITPSKRLEGARLGDKAIPWSCAWRAPQLRLPQSQMPFHSHAIIQAPEAIRALIHLRVRENRANGMECSVLDFSCHR